MNSSLRRKLLSLTTLLLFSACALASNPRWHWEARFSEHDRQQLQDWVLDAQGGLERMFGKLPYQYDVHFHRRPSSREPVPWANTRKGYGRRAVNFHVDVSHDWEDFYADWTAPHELSHLMFPYLGQSGSWFAEGIASYLQYQAMYAAGNLSWDRAIARYRDRFSAAARQRRAGDTPIAELPAKVRRTGSYVRMYWGGAAFFLHADHRLAQQHGIRLHDVIREYIDCCFYWRDNAMDMIRKFDRISDSNVFSELYDEKMMERGFPRTSQALAWLAENPPKLDGKRARPRSD